jgi:hypothetical protein
MYQAEGVSITAGDYGMASELGDPSERADRAMPETAARRGARSRVLVVDDEPEIVAYLLEPVGAVRLKNITEPIETQRIFGPSSRY